MEPSTYRQNQLIAYIGNKRRLVPSLEATFRELTGDAARLRFADPFAGSGAVSRLARTLGWEVHANDWEDYAYVVNACHLTLSPSSFDDLFDTRADALYRELNDLERRPGFIAHTYAPRSTRSADYRRERLFYTRENAMFLDTLRSRVEELYPSSSDPTQFAPAKLALVAGLVYQAATHANTSGVFKAFHKGFGGFGGDALTRIMKPMVLQRPLLWDSPVPAYAYRQDATEFLASSGSYDLCYLDPPYNQHQYGSNYHLLNTLVRYDNPQIDNSLTLHGELSQKAGIRTDWTATRSSYCSRATASTALEELIDSVDARLIVASYNTEGIIPLEEFIDILEKSGRVDIRVDDYVTYRGGKQSAFRKNHNLEFQIILRRDKARRSSNREGMRRILALRSLISTLKATYSRARLAEEFPRSGNGFTLTPGTTVFLDDDYHVSHVDGQDQLERLPTATLSCLQYVLESAQFDDKRQECESLLASLRRRAVTPSLRRTWQRALLVNIKKLAFKKYRFAYESVVSQLKKDLAEGVDMPIVAERLQALEDQAAKRFAA
jgi:adenine-specific DNA-methyltransferase